MKDKIKGLAVLIFFGVYAGAATGSVLGININGLIFFVLYVTTLGVVFAFASYKNRLTHKYVLLAIFAIPQILALLSGSLSDTRIGEISLSFYDDNLTNLTTGWAGTLDRLRIAGLDHVAVELKIKLSLIYIGLIIVLPLTLLVSPPLFSKKATLSEKAGLTMLIVLVIVYGAFFMNAQSENCIVRCARIGTVITIFPPLIAGGLSLVLVAIRAFYIEIYTSHSKEKANGL